MENLVSEKVSVSENLVSKKKVLGSVLKKIGLGKSLGFGEFGFRKKSFGFGTIWSWKKVLVSVSEDLVSEKKKSK